MNLQMHKPLMKTTIGSVEKRVSKTNLIGGKGVLDASKSNEKFTISCQSFVKTEPGLKHRQHAACYENLSSESSLCTFFLYRDAIPRGFTQFHSQPHTHHHREYC